MLTLYNQGNATAPGEALSSTQLSLNQWYCVEVHAKFNDLPPVAPTPPYENNAIVAWRVNNIQVGSHNREGLVPSYGIDRYNQKAIQSQLGDAANYGKGLEIDYADWIADSLGWVGLLRRVTVLRPTGAGTYSGWTGNNSDYRHQLDFPFPSGSATLGVSTTTASERQSFAVETPESKGLGGGFRSARIAVFFGSVGGTNIKLILRRNGTDTEFDIGTPVQSYWSSWRIDASGWSADDTIEIGVVNSASPYGTTRVSACALLLEHDAPTPATSPDCDVRVLQTTYTGNGTQQSINLAAIDADVASLVPSLVMVFPESGTSPGAWWWDSRAFASACNNAGASGDIVPAAGVVHVVGALGPSNQNSITYRLIAFFDPTERIAVRGALALNASTDDREVRLGKDTFTPEAVFIARESAPSNDSTRIYYRGAGLTDDESVSLGADIAVAANAVQALDEGSFEVGTLVNEATQDFGFMAWRTSQFTESKLVAITSYAGNGSNPRTISLDLDGSTPIFALVVPSNNGKRWTRYGSVAKQVNGSTSGSANAITAFGSDELTVGSELNTNGVTYSVFALAAGVDPAPERRLILLLGYWPPTDVGNMLAAFATRQQYRKLNGQLTNYDVLALSATFAATDDTWPSSTVKFWGADTGGAFHVDYKNTSASFWNRVPDEEPIALLSFSWMGSSTPQWKLEANGRNLAQGAWLTDVDYWPGGTLPKATYAIDPPYIGGSAQDPSPFQNQGPQTDDPPDPTQVAGFSRLGLEPPLTTSIANAVAANTGLTAGLGLPNTAGDYVSEFMAYHVAWYRGIYESCLLAGHTHVAEGITAATGELAVRSQLDALLDALP